MDSFWWNLPGPARFLDRIENDLRSGRNIIVRFPERAPVGFREAVFERIIKSEIRVPQLISADQLSLREDPASEIRRILVPSIPLPGWQGIKSLAGAAEFAGYLIWIEGLGGNGIKPWLKFLSEYQRACQLRDDFDRSLFCIPVHGLLDDAYIAEDVVLGVHRWCGVPDRLDMASWVARNVSNRRGTPVLRRMAIWVAVELAGTDPVLAMYLASVDLQELLSPTRLLKKYADEACLPPCKGEKAPEWEKGQVDEFDGTEYIHSAVLAMQDQEAAIRRRIWRGQVGVLFPTLEEVRVDLIERYRAGLRKHISALERPVDSPDELDIGQIYYLAQKFRMSANDHRLVRRVWEMRNRLAHLEPVDAKTLSDPVVRSAIG